MHRVPVIDLFAGAGGFGVAAQSSGGDLRLSVELDPAACNTLRANADEGHKVLEADVTTLTGQGLREEARLAPSDELVIVGGAPCQPFSKASYWRDPGHEADYRRAKAAGEDVRKPPQIAAAKEDERRDLVQEFARLVIETKASGFVFENVPSILHRRNRELVASFIGRLEEAGHHCRLVKVNSAQFGAPQQRERVFVMGARRDIPAEPQATHSAEASMFLNPFVSVGDAIEKFAGDQYFEPEEVVKGTWAEHLETVPPGWNYKAHTAWGGHPNPTWETETRFWNFLLKLHPERVSWTLAANPGPWTGPFHWESRRLRTPELAAIQGFPEGYKFVGNRRERVRQIGNAVPPPMAGAALAQVLELVA